MASQQPPVRKFSWEIPGILKTVSEWYKSLSIIALVLGMAATYFLGAEQGPIVGILVACLFVAIFFSFRAIGYAASRVDDAIAMLSSTEYTKVEVREPVVQGLRRWKKWIFWQFVVSVLIILAALVLVFYNPALDYLTTKKPSRIGFADMRYFNPQQEENLLEATPFLQAVVSSLASEGLAEGKKFRIALGSTEPFQHPTPRFNCSLVIAKGKYGVTGYAFRRHFADGRYLYEAVIPDYSKGSPIVFNMPPSKQGDQFFVIVRLTSEDGSDFPQDIQNAYSLKPVNPED